MVKYGARLAQRARHARAHRPDAQRGVPAAAARGRAASCASGSRSATDDLDDARAAGHVPRPRRPRPRGAAGRLRARPTRCATARASSSPTRSRAGRCRPRATRPTTRRCSRRRSTPSWRSRLGADPDGPVGALPRRLAPRRERARRPGAGSRARSRGAPRSTPPAVPAALGREHGGSASTQQAFGRFFADLAREAPDGGRARGHRVARRRHLDEPRRLDQQGRRVVDRATGSTGSPTTRTRSCAGGSPTTAATSSSASPRSTSSACSASSARRGRAPASRCCRWGRSTTRSSPARSSRGRSASTRAGSRSSSGRRAASRSGPRAAPTSR